MISHRKPDGSEHPVVFASRTLTKSERNYAQIEKEALALIFGVSKFHQFLYGRRFTLVTDHKPLKTILGSKNKIPPLAAARMQRWALTLSAYVYDIEFRPTGKHENADGLSRRPLTTEPAAANPDGPSVFNVMQMDTLPIKSSEIMAATWTDPILSKVLYCLRHRWPEKLPDSPIPFGRRREELMIEGDCILWETRVVVPSKFRSAVLSELHHGKFRSAVLSEPTL